MTKRLLLFLALSLPLRALTGTFTNDGLDLDGGGLAHVTIGYPQLCDTAGTEIHPIAGKTLAPDGATVNYEGGTRAQVTFTADGTLTVHFNSPSADIQKVTFQILIPFPFGTGGTWQIDKGNAEPFPEAQPPKPTLYGGPGQAVQIKGADGHGFSFHTPPYGWQEVADFRQWNWKTYAWRSHVSYDPKANAEIHFAVMAIGADVAPVVLYDRFGQSVSKDWPGKLKSEDELKSDITSDQAYYDSFTPPALDPFGGQPGSGKKLGLTATGFFHVEKVKDRWCFVDPDGNLFFHLGICCFSPETQTYVGGRRGDFEWVPPLDGEYATAFYHDTGGVHRDDVSYYLANLIRKYGQPIDNDSFSARMIPRVRKWGFNSVGAFSSPAHKAWTEAQFPYVDELPINPWDGIQPLPGLARVLDPFDEKVRAKFDVLCADQVAKLANDPLLIGYFLENEPLYEEVPRVIPGLKGSENPCKRKLVDQLHQKYGTIEALDQAWNLSAKSFDELLDLGFAATTPAARTDLQAYTDLFFETYFSWMQDTFHKYDKHHLLIGNRLQMGTINNESLCRTMGRHLDVISFNYYTYDLDKNFLNKIHQWTGDKPMILSEFYWSSTTDSGLPGGVRDVNSQQERGLAYRNYVEQATTLNYIVGIEWFTLVDQPVSGEWWGKYQGENGNTGLFSIADRPWKETVAEMAKTNDQIYPLLLGLVKPFIYDNPRFQTAANPRLTVQVGHATGPVTVDGGTQNWPGFPAVPLGSRLVAGPSLGGLEASFKMCWDEKNLYFFAHVTDSTPLKNLQTGSNLWMGDGVELFLGWEKPGQEGALLPSDRQVLIGANSASGKPAAWIMNAPQQPDVATVSLPDIDGKGYTLEAAIPFTALGFQPKAGDIITFDVSLDDSADGKQRLRQIAWNGIDRNSSERGQWGRALFLK